MKEQFSIVPGSSWGTADSSRQVRVRVRVLARAHVCVYVCLYVIVWTDDRSLRTSFSGQLLLSLSLFQVCAHSSRGTGEYDCI